MKFPLDEHVAHAVAVGLRMRGIDVTTTAEIGTRGATDEEHLNYAMREVRSIFTNDADFLRMAEKGLEHAGIVYCVSGSKNIGEIVKGLSQIGERLDPAEMMNRVEYL